MARIARLTALLALLGSVLVLTASASAEPRYGVVTQTDLGERDFARMERGGVDTLRFLIRPRLVEPAPGVFDWSSVDPIVAGAARHGIGLLPFVYGSPSWVDPVEAHPPLDTDSDRSAWRRLMTTLVERYGPGGGFWAQSPAARPIRRWQIWNEPNFDLYWDPAPSAGEYARLVHISAAAIRGADPTAKVVLAGVATVPLGRRVPRYLAHLYRWPRIKRDFDLAALHPYAAGVRLLDGQVQRVRRVMREAGDRRTPLAVTEVGWASAGTQRAPLVVGESAQASLLKRSFRNLARHPKWRVGDVQWYAWRDSLNVETGCSFCAHSGLFDLDGEPKAAWRAFQAVAR